MRRGVRFQKHSKLSNHANLRTCTYSGLTMNNAANHTCTSHSNEKQVGLTDMVEPCQGLCLCGTCKLGGSQKQGGEGK